MRKPNIITACLASELEGLACGQPQGAYFPVTYRLIDDSQTAMLFDQNLQQLQQDKELLFSVQKAGDRLIVMSTLAGHRHAVQLPHVAGIESCRTLALA